MTKKMIYSIIALLVLLVLWSVWGYYGSHVEQAEYAVVKKTADYEIREYPAHIVAQATVKGSPDAALNEGFSIVAGYIFGGNTKRASIAMTAPVVSEQGEKIAMTAPVVVEKGEQIAMTAPVVVEQGEQIAMTAPVVAKDGGETQIISFGMPRGYTLETLPTPNDPRVKIVEVPAKKFAVLRFSWYRSEARVKSMQEKLLSLLERDGVATGGKVAYAGYNAPWTPPWMVRNEVMVELSN